MSHKEINLEEILHKEQNYVSTISEELKIPIKAMVHDEYTNTCFEKAKILGWDAKRIVKVVYFHNKKNLYGFIFPEIGEMNSPKYISQKEILPNLLNISKKKSKEYVNSYSPLGMEFGTCTPFARKSLFYESNTNKEIVGMPITGLFIYDLDEIKDEIVDISIGGNSEFYHKCSLHLPYGGICDIINKEFPGKISKIKNI